MDTKRCFSCEQDKPISMYSKMSAKPDGLNIYCKECARSKCRVYYDRNKKAQQRRTRVGVEKRRLEAETFLNEVLARYGCQLCGEKDLIVLDFHHVNDKKHGIAEMKCRGYCLETIKLEVKKCVVLCSNCHRRVHAGTRMVNDHMLVQD